MTNQFNFEQLAQNLINESMEQSETPFRSAVADAFSTISTSLKVIDSVAKSAYFASVELQLDQMNSLLASAKRMDARNNHNALLAQLKANELMKAMEASNAQ
jgi:hypothetical protein